ncbi:MAG: glycosyltransferase [Acidimicrobiia bacterium]
MSCSIDVLMAVHNGADWLPDVLASLTAQTQSDFRLTVWDNASTDDTVDVIARVTPSAQVIRSEENIGFWAAIEELTASSSGEVFLALTDVQLAPDFLARAVVPFSDPRVGAVQGKLLQLRDGARTSVIDTVGFSIDRSRRVTISGHGEDDRGQYDECGPIFAVEGAAPMFRTEAFRESAVQGHVIDPAFRRGALGYGDDLDLAWRLALFGWSQILVPDAIGWHDRSTTHDVATGLLSHLGRVRQRREIPLEKRILDWVNVRAARLKNDRTRDVLRALPFIALRELTVLLYMLVVEPRVLAALPRFGRLVPQMVRRRRIVQSRARADLREWFT